ncbi:MAG: GntR family transcriptional regulator [Cryobacterium sp.]|nr:GntR family transcriptional regulator [Cryobacterium sp.]
MSPRLSGSTVAKFDNSTRQLKYQHVYDLILNLIEDEGLKPGDKLPSTSELAEMSKVSVISVRRALDELTYAGRIIRHQGVGTFVAPERLVSEPTHSGTLLDTILDSEPGLNFETKLLSIQVGFPSAAHAKALEIETGQPVWEVVRLRSLELKPKVLEQAVLPLSRVASLDEKRLAAGESLYRLLEERFNLTDAFVEQTIKVDQPTQWECTNLGVTTKDVVVRIRGVSFSEDGIPFDSYQQTYRARDFVFYVTGSQHPTLLKPSEARRWTITPLGHPDEEKISPLTN